MKNHYCIILLILNAVIYSQTITIVTEQAPPYNYSVGDTVKGVSTEIVQTVMELAGLEFTIKVYPPNVAEYALAAVGSVITKLPEVAFTRTVRSVKVIV